MPRLPPVPGSFWSGFYSAVRLYLTAAPEAILELLADAESGHVLKVYTWPRDFSWVRPFFFSDRGQLAQRINGDQSGDRWLVFIDSIEEGMRFSESLHVSRSLANAKTRENDPEKWEKLLEEEGFKSKALISTSVLDCGVNFKDISLRKVATLSHHPDKIIQQLGRKRRKKGEIVELYLHDLPLNEVRRRKSQASRVLDALEKIDHRAFFLSKYIYGEDLPQIRKHF